MVGYTALAQMLDDDGLAALVQRFNELAHDTVTAVGGRVVKSIGDEVMYIADQPSTASDIALRLTERTDEDPLVPESRAGVASGTLLSRDGDYFGPVVNLASRLTELARPSSVLVSSEVGHALDGDGRFRLRRIPSRKIRDIGRVEVYRLESGRS